MIATMELATAKFRKESVSFLNNPNDARLIIIGTHELEYQNQNLVKMSANEKQESGTQIIRDTFEICGRISQGRRKRMPRYELCPKQEAQPGVLNLIC